MAKEQGLKCEVYGAEKLHELKMGAFWAVSQGSEEPPALIVITYEPEGAAAEPVLGLVGKGITFDTGGISIKPADGMEKMKYDMAGGAAMLGAMRAISELKPKVKVIAIVCASENMPSGKAYKPGDIEIAMSGKSIEVMNTDAEGRMVLADGLTYAKSLGATHLIDAATLTGACVVALGMVNAGVFLERRRGVLALHPGAQHLGRAILATAGRGRLSRTDPVEHCRHHEHRRKPLGWGDHCSHVPEGVCGGDSVDSPRHRRRRLDGRAEALDRKRPNGCSRAQPGGVGEELREVAGKRKRKADGPSALCFAFDSI